MAHPCGEVPFLLLHLSILIYKFPFLHPIRNISRGEGVYHASFIDWQ